MSVPVWKRAENRKLETLEKAIELAAHTIKCCDNDNVFPKRHRLSITADIIKEAKSVVKLINRANDKDLITEYKERYQLQIKALDTIKDLEMDLQISYFALKPNITDKKLDNWLRLIDETRTLCKKWIKSNRDERNKVLNGEIDTTKDNG